MTPHEIELAMELDGCGCTGARFMRDMSYAAKHDPEREITDRQRYYMEMLAWRYRRQIAAHLVPETKPPTLPAKRREPKPPKPGKAPAERHPDLFGSVA
jgi:hypothetical protein